MTKIIGTGLLKPFSQELILDTSIKVQDLPGLLKIPAELAEITIIVREHQKLDDDDLIHANDEIILFMAVMGG